MASVNPLGVVDAHGPGGLEALIAEVDKLVSLPDIYYRLEQAVIDPGSTTDGIAALLRSDPDLCARLLRMANSAFYSFPTPVETIERAVKTLGLRQIRELVLLTSVIRAFDGVPPGAIDMRIFWEHSIAVAFMAAELGRRARMPSADGIYVCGLLHDIGRLVMLLKLPEISRDLFERRSESGIALYRLEYDMLGYSHAEVGGRLLEFWKLPPSIWEPVAAHHRLGASAEYLASACAVHVADAWVNSNRGGSRGEDCQLGIDPEVDAFLDTDIESLDEAGRAAGEQAHTLARQFVGH